MNVSDECSLRRIQGDGKELWRSQKIADANPVAFNIDVSKINELNLTVEDAGNGNGSDWGIWMEPNLEPPAPRD